MSSSYPKSTEAIHGTARMLAQYVAEASDDRFQIEVHAAGELTPAKARHASVMARQAAASAR